MGTLWRTDERTGAGDHALPARLCRVILSSVCGWALAVGASGRADAAEAKPTYAAMAPMAEYRVVGQGDEIALARSAAPPTISGEADVLTLGDHGYETVAKGRNGFACLVQRSWAAGFNDAQFWNPKLRAPICMNAAAVRTVLPSYLERTGWVVAGVSKSEMMERTKAEIAAHRFTLPEPGAMAFMMSQGGYLGDAVGHWHPHLMIFFAKVDSLTWGANLKGSPIFADKDDSDPVTTFFVPVTTWSDGTSAAMEPH